LIGLQVFAFASAAMLPKLIHREGAATA